MDHISKTKNRTKKLLNTDISPFQNIPPNSDFVSKSIITQKMNIAKIGKFILLSSQNIVQIFGQKNKNCSF